MASLIRLASSTAAAAALCVVCSTARAQDAPPVSPGVVPPAGPTMMVAPVTPDTEIVRETIRPNRTLLTTGILTMAATYLPAVAVAATSERPGDDKLYIPFAGPFMDLGARPGCGPDTGMSCARENVNKAFLIASGVGQIAALAQIVAAFVAPEHRNILQLRGSAKIQVTPAQLGRGGYGLAAFGQF